jgi:undecaprenyl-diphosphatase
VAYGEVHFYDNRNWPKGWLTGIFWRMKTSLGRWWQQGYGWLRSQDLRVLLMFLAVLLGFWGFVALAGAVSEGDTRAVDEWALRALRSPSDLSDPIGPEWLEEPVRDITALGSVAVLSLVTGAVAGFVILQKQYHALGLLLAAIAGGLVLNLVLKTAFDRPRPELVPALMRVSTASFPSGHALLSAVVYLTLGALMARLVGSRKLKIYILCVAQFLTFLVGLSRMYLGVHYPTDVLAGWTVGLVWAILCWLVARALQRRGAIEKPVARK